MDSRRDFTSKKVFSGYFSELGEKANSALPMSKRKATLHVMDQQLADLSQLLGATEAKTRMADIIVDRMVVSYSAQCDSNEAFVYR